jgi:hypothetical protein
MNDHRRFAFPRAHEGNQPFDVFEAGLNLARHRIDDVMDVQPQVIATRNLGRERHLVFYSQERNDMARAGRLDGLVQTGKRANVNHARQYTIICGWDATP